MRRLALAALLAASASTAQAQTKAAPTVLWRASSTTAMAITGDIRVGPDRIVIGKRSFKLTYVRDLTDAENAEAADLLSSKDVKGRLYRVNVPAKATFQHGNRLCSGAATRLVFVEREELTLIAFEGEREIFFPDWKNAIRHVCGTMGYSRS